LLSRLGVALALAGCAPTTVRLRSNHFHVGVPSDWQMVEVGGDPERPTTIRTPATDGAPEVELRLYAWTVQTPPADAADDVVHRLAGQNALGPATARSDNDEPCPDRAAQFFVLGKPARAIHLADGDGRRIVVTAGESGASLVGIVASVAPSGAGCADTQAMDAAVERVAASLTGAEDLSRPSQAPTIVPSADLTRVPP
jgi:hypothetical protein